MNQNNKKISRDFVLVVIGQIISLFGNQILRYALPLYLLNQTGSSAIFGTISACSFIPMLILYPVGGIIADRMNKKNIMVILDFSTSLLTIGFCVLENRMNSVLLIGAVMMILYAIQGAYQPAVKSSIPLLVENEKLVQANSIIDVISSLSNVAGPIVGGILFSAVGLAPILVLSIMCFALSAVMELFIKIPYEPTERNGNLFLVGIQDMKESVKFIIKEQPTIWKMSIFYASVNLFLSSLIMIATPVIITQHLGFETGEANRLYGYSQGVLALGSVLGGSLAGMLAKKIKTKDMPSIIIGASVSILIAGAGLQFGTTKTIAYGIMVFGCTLMLVLTTLFTIRVMSYIQIVTPRHLIGKIISCVICLCMCTNPVGQFIYGMVYEHVGNQYYIPFYIAAILMVGISMYSHKFFKDISM